MEYHNCRVCEKIYETHTKNDENSDEELKYARYLGFCRAKCYDKLSDKDKQREHIFAYLKGDLNGNSK